MTLEEPTTGEELRAYALAGGELTPEIIERFKMTITRPGPRAEPVPDALDLPTRVKSLRLPLRVVNAVEAVDHPAGFSGVVREALEEWLERHTGTEAEINDARLALDTLARIIQRYDKAA